MLLFNLKERMATFFCDGTQMRWFGEHDACLVPNNNGVVVYLPIDGTNDDLLLSTSMMELKRVNSARTMKVACLRLSSCTE